MPAPSTGTPPSRFVTLPKASVVAHAPAPTQVYELRVLEGSPVQTVNVPLKSSGRAATFTEYRGCPPMGVDGAFSGPRQFGNRQALTEAEVKDVHAFVASRVVSMQKGAAGVYEATDPILRGMSLVRPLAEFLSMELLPAESLAAEVAKPVAMAG